MFDRTVNVMKSYDATLRSAWERYEKVQKEYKNNYIGAKLEEKMNEATATLNNVIFNEKEAAKKIVESEFKETMEQMNKVLTEPAPVDFLSTIEAIKASGADMSDYESEIYVNNYRNNYIACKAILGVLHNVHKAQNMAIYNAEAVKNEIESAKGVALEYFSNWDRNSLATSLYLSDGTNPLLVLAAKLQPFFNHDFILSVEK